MEHGTCFKPIHPSEFFVFPKWIIEKSAHYCQHNWFNTSEFEFCHTGIQAACAAEEDKEGKERQSCFIVFDWFINSNV